ncbi:MAG: InlB B-repeat-containing protein [Christensenellales bacterium]|jgi:hypothetical protein
MKNKFLFIATLLMLVLFAPILASCNEIQVEVQINVLSSSIKDGSVSGDGIYMSGERITITATPENGKEFVAWIKNNELVSQDAEYTFTLTKNSGGTYVAIFTSNNPTYYQISNLTMTARHKLDESKFDTFELTLNSIELILNPVNTNINHTIYENKEMAFEVTSQGQSTETLDANSLFFLRKISTYSIKANIKYNLNQSGVNLTRTQTVILTSLTPELDENEISFLPLELTFDNTTIIVSVNLNLYPALPQPKPEK